MTARVLVLAPTRRARTETFVRANLARLPFAVEACFGDEIPCREPLKALYGLAVLISKVCTRLGWLRLATLPASIVAVLLVRRHRPDVVMVEFGFHAVRVMELARTGVPLAVHFRGADASAERYLKRLEQRYRRLFQLTSAVIVKNQIMRSRLIALGAPPAQLVISPSGADEQRFQGATPASMPPRFLAVGRFVSKKGPMDTLEAFALLRGLTDKADSCRLVMVGDGPLLPVVQERVRQLGLEQLVQFPGVLPPDAVVEEMRRARAFVQHSRTAEDGDEEGCPVSVMEAQLCGLPVVATRHGGIPDVVVDQQTGRLVEEGDRLAMAEAMALLVDRPDLAAAWGAAGHRRAQAQFTVAHHVDQITMLLNDLMGHSR
ncbi:MAG: glycosyl transferase family 1 [Synechococcus sp. NAT40]|nr:glycosyl transferase family 1 [Synechococcus sp. NAT40]